MKITIDTKEDSHEELRKVIKMLSSLVGEEVMSNQGNIFGDSSEGASGNAETPSSQAGGSDIFNMFSSSGSENKTEETAEDKKETKEETDIDIPEIEEYR